MVVLTPPEVVRDMPMAPLEGPEEGRLSARLNWEKCALEMLKFRLARQST